MPDWGRPEKIQGRAGHFVQISTQYDNLLPITASKKLALRFQLSWTMHMAKVFPNFGFPIALFLN